MAKDTEIPPEDAPLGDQYNRLFKGTAVTAGNGRAIVTGIGQQTELGKIATMVEEAERTATPLEEKLDALAKVLIWVTVGLAAVFLLVGFLRGEELEQLIKTSVALAIAAIPEGMSVVATIALANGMLRLAKKKVIVKRLSAVETLGGTNVIFTDKTGTLTQNRIDVDRVHLNETSAQVRIDTDARKVEVEDGDTAITDADLYPKLIQVGVLCNNADFDVNNGETREVGDPVEVALLKFAYAAGMNPDEVKAQFPRKAEKAFSSDTRIMGTLHEAEGRWLVAVKGAVEEVLERCGEVPPPTTRKVSKDLAGLDLEEQAFADSTDFDSEDQTRKFSENLEDQTRKVFGDLTGLHPKKHSEDPTRKPVRRSGFENLTALSEQLSAEGLRTLAFAYRETDQRPGENFADENLTWLGLIGFLDPPRLEVTPALEACRKAGIKVIMVTGDHPATALTIARQVKLVEEGEDLALTGKDLKPLDQLSDSDKERIRQCRVFARVSPGQKLDMIELYQQNGDVVGMTGDGVNDAPALKKSDIGIAMGLRGTQVAAETADMVLKDDSFTSIVTAIGQGRVIFENIRKFVLFLLSCNMSEIFVVTFAGFLAVGNPLLPLQILFINIVTDVFPALALGVGEENRELMKQPPRDPKTPILTVRDWRLVVFYALSMTVSVLAVYWFGTQQWGLSAAVGNTITFYSLSLAQVLHVFNLYSGDSSFFRNEITRNRYIWLATGVCIGILFLTYYVPFLRDVLSIQPLDAAPLELIAAAGVLPLIIVQLGRWLFGFKE